MVGWLVGGAFVRDAGPLPPEEAGDPNALHTREPRAGPYKGPKGEGMRPRIRRAAGPCWLDRTGANAPDPLAHHHNGDMWRHYRGLSSPGRPLDVSRGHSSGGTTGPRLPSTWVPFEAGQPRRLAVSWCGLMVGRRQAGEGEPWLPRRIPHL